MKGVSLALLLACVIGLVAAQWSNTDHEVCSTVCLFFEASSSRQRRTASSDEGPLFFSLLPSPPQIFDIQAALEKDEGAGASFYSIMNISKKATAIEINRAYRKTSMALQ